MNTLVLMMIAISVSVAVLAADTTRPTTRAAKFCITLAGDSTVTEHAGWGLGFRHQVGPDVEVINVSQGGRSSKSFYDEGHWTKALATKADYVLIQFGHNDEPGKGPDRETDPTTTYRTNMERYVDQARAAGMKPVLVTSIARRRFNPDGKIRSSLAPYVDVVKQIAKEKNVPLIDLQADSITYYEKIGKEACHTFEPKQENGGFDSTHFNEIGSEIFATMVIRQLRQQVPELAAVIPEPKTSEKQ